MLAVLLCFQRLLDSDVATIAGMRNAVSAPPLGRLSSTHSTESLAAELSRDQHDPVLPPETVIQVMARFYIIYAEPSPPF